MSCLPGRPATHRIALLAVTGAVATSLLSGCGAGQIAQTARQVAPVEGAQINRGGIAIRNAEVATPPGGVYAAGGDAPLYVAIATDDSTSDTLTGVTSDAAPSVDVVSIGTASAAASPSASASASAAPSASPPMNVPLAPASLTEFRDGGAYLQLRGLTRTLTPGTTLRVTFSFARAGDVTLDVPVATPSTPGPRPTPSPAVVQ